MSSAVAGENSNVNGSLVYQLKHKWTIKDFASNYLADSSDKATYPKLFSEWFSSSLDCQTQFRLVLRPRGENEKSQTDLGLHLELKRSRPSLVKSADLVYKFSLLNLRNESCFLKEFRHKFVYPSCIGGSNTFMKRTVLKNPAKCLLPSDQLTILAEITVIPESVSQHEPKLLEKLKVASIENVNETLARLLDSSVHSDVVLVVNKEKLPAHKTLLSAHSPVFSAMFKTEMADEKEGKVRQVKMCSMKLDVAKKLLRFIYTGEVAELEEYAEELLVAADKYGITRLKALCSQVLCGQVDTENAARLFTFANRHSVDQLMRTCVAYIRAHLEDVCLTPKWKFAQKVFLEELRELKEKEKQETGENQIKSETPEDTSIRSMFSVAAEESSTVNGSLKYRLQFNWTIKDFAATYLVNPSDTTPYPVLRSEWHSSSRDSQTQFRLILCPKGREETPNYLLVYLEMSRSGASPLAKSVDINFKASLLNERKEKCRSREFRQKCVYPADYCTLPKFLSHSALQDAKKGLLPGDQLTIIAEIDVFPEPVIQQVNELLLAKLKVESIENVRASLAGILDSGEHRDVALEVDGGGSGLAAHKAILSLRSPVFTAMFKTEMTEQKEGKVKIPDLKMEVAQALLRFIYTGEVADLEEYAEELLVAADKYDVALLKDLCGEYLCGQVNTENAARLLAIADRHSVPQLKSISFDYIHSHWDDVLLTDDWLLVQELFTKELRQLKHKEKQGEKRKAPEKSESAK